MYTFTGFLCTGLFTSICKCYDTMILCEVFDEVYTVCRSSLCIIQESMRSGGQLMVVDQMAENIDEQLSSEGPFTGTGLKLRSREFGNIPCLTSWDPNRGPKAKASAPFNDPGQLVIKTSQALLSSANDNVYTNGEEEEYGLMLLVDPPLDCVTLQGSLTIDGTPPVSLLNPFQRFVEVEPPMYGSRLAPDDAPLDLSKLLQEATMNVELFPFFNMDGESSPEEQKLMEIWRYELGEEEEEVPDLEQQHQDDDSIFVKAWQKLFHRGVYSPENQHMQNDPWYRITQQISSRENSDLHTPLTPPAGYQRFQVEDEENHVISYFPTY